MNKREKAIKNEIRHRNFNLEEIKKINFDRCMTIEAYDENNNKIYIAIPQDYVRTVAKNLHDVHEKLLKIEEDKLKQFYSEQ